MTVALIGKWLARARVRLGGKRSLVVASLLALIAGAVVAAGYTVQGSLVLLRRNVSWFNAVIEALENELGVWWLAPALLFACLLAMRGVLSAGSGEREIESSGETTEPPGSRERVDILAERFVGFVASVWAPVFRWTISSFLIGCMVFFYAESKERAQEIENNDDTRRLLTKTATDAVSQIRVALVELASSCLVRSLPSAGGAAHATVLDDPVCSKAYGRAIEGWTRASWTLPTLIAETTASRLCAGTPRAGVRDASTILTQPSLTRAACRRLSGPAALERASGAYRRFVRAYARFQSGTSSDLVELKLHAGDVFDETRKLNCALLLASDAETDVPACFCRQMLLGDAGIPLESSDACRGHMKADGQEINLLELDDLTAPIEL